MELIIYFPSSGGLGLMIFFRIRGDEVEAARL